MNELNIRPAGPEDSATIYGFIMKMARYEKLESEVDTTEQALRKSLFEERQAEVVLGELNGRPVGFALFFHNFSTFRGQRGLYLEDIYVDEEYRGRGYGKRLLIHLVKLAAERRCRRMEWVVLDWNAPSIAFYRSLGAVPMDEWTVFRLTEDKIRELDERMEEFEQEKEEQSRRLEAEKKQMHRRMEEEADAARLDLDREIADEKKRTHSALMEQVRFFHESYNQYLSGIMAQMDLLSKTAVSVGSRFLTMDVPDVQGMFRSEMQEPAIEDSASDSEVRQVPVLNSSESRQTESKERIPLHGNAVGDASEEVVGSYMDEGEERVDRVLNILKKNMETDALRN